MVPGPRARGSGRAAAKAVIPRRAASLAVREYVVNMRSIIIGRTSRLFIGDHLEGQFEGQNAASKGLREPAAASVS
jgi:hypothetical protein